jgi:FlaA1/EpsC-like NDP-sugar epimerase
LQLATDATIVALALAAAYLMRFEGIPNRIYLKQFLLVLPYLVLLRLAVFTAFGVYRLVWRYISLRDIPRIMLAAATGSAAIVAARFVLKPAFDALGFKINRSFTNVPYGVLAAELVMCSVGMVAARALWRMLKERERRLGKTGGAAPPESRRPKQRALLLGAGSAGVMVAREVTANPDQVGFEVVGFLDDDPNKLGTIIVGYKVMGTTEQMVEFAHKLEAQLVVLTMANVPAATVRRIVDTAEAAELTVKIIPGLYEILSGKVNISKIRDVAIEDLLGRAPVRLEEESIEAFLTGKRVLVTGAGGSIGSEICRQVCRYQPRELLLLDQAENPLFHIHRELVGTFSGLSLVPIVGNVANRQRMRQVLERCRPDVVFHAAAHKHVPLMEANPGEAIRNNIQGSRNMADLALEFYADAFVMISTDKAVNPTSVMGATKRLAEMYVQALASSSHTRFLTVRFGNVLGSEGSVVPIFKEQIARGGPVTVTHPEMKRYFMTIPEASQLVLQAAAMGQGGEIFILEMGEPISIVSLARDLIKLSGFRPDEDIQIEFSGVRPGEKLYEEINLNEEHATKTKHPRIWIGESRAPDLEGLREGIDELMQLIATASPEALRGEISRRVPEYVPTVTPAFKALLGPSKTTTGPLPASEAPQAEVISIQKPA